MSRARPVGVAGRARHDACGRAPVARPASGCAPVGTLLYLVTFDHPAFGTLLKFGCGDHERIVIHRAAGAVPRQVLRASRPAVVAAERALRGRYRWDAVGPIEAMPLSFGAGRDVVPALLAVDLRDVLTGPDVVDVTHLFGPVGGGQRPVRATATR